MKKAWIENNVVRDVCEGDPAELYHSEVAVNYSTDVPDDITNGAKLENGVWVNLPVVEVEHARTFTVFEVRNGLTLAERSKWDNDITNAIKTAKIEFSVPKFEAAATEILQFLVDSGDISQASMDKILA